MDDESEVTLSELQDYHDDYWQNLTDSLLLHIFSFLDSGSLINAGKTCQNWNRISLDEILWKHLVLDHLQTNTCILPKDKTSWRSEYERLVDRVPHDLFEGLERHTNEIYHIAFSASGKLISTTGKDGSARVWQFDLPSRLYAENTNLDQTVAYTRFSEFNQSENLLLVTGLVGHYDYNSVILILAVPQGSVNGIGSLPILHAVSGSNSNFRGAWLDNSSFINGKLHNSLEYLMISKNEVNLSKVSKTCTEGVRDVANLIHKCNEKEIPLLQLPWSDTHDFARIVSLPQSCTNKQLDIPSSVATNTSMDDTDSITSDSEDCTNTEEERNPEKLSNQTELSSPCTHSQINSSGMNAEDLCEPSTSSAGTNNTCLKVELEDPHTSTWCAGDFTDITNLTKKDLNNTNDIQKVLILKCSVENVRQYPADERLCLYKIPNSLRVPDSRGDALPLKNENGKPFQTIECTDHPGSIVGVSLSADKRYIAYNIRPNRFDEDEFLGISPDKHTMVYDLKLMCNTELSYIGYDACSSRHVSYIFPAVCEDYVASGSEHLRGFLWDRHYGTLLHTFLHDNQPGDGGVNATVFHPNSSEICLTVADDRKINVWVSKHLVRESQAKTSHKIGHDLEESAGAFGGDDALVNFTFSDHDDDEISDDNLTCCVGKRKKKKKQRVWKY